MFAWPHLNSPSGALGTIEATTAAYPGYLKRIEIHGSEGTAVIEEEDIKTWEFAKTIKRDDAVKAIAWPNRKAAAAEPAIPRRSATTPTRNNSPTWSNLSRKIARLLSMAPKAADRSKLFWQFINPPKPGKLSGCR